MSLCRVALVLSVSLASSCSLLFSADPGDDGLSASDGGVTSADAGVQRDADGCTSVSPHVDTCEIEEKDGGLPLLLYAFGTYTLNTQELILTGPAPEMLEIPMTGKRYTLADGTVIFLVRTETLEIAAGTTLRAIGDVPLVIIARNTIQLRGTIDVSSANTQDCMQRGQGTGANPDACLVFHQTTSGNNVGSGGGGGGFGSAGGASFSDDTSGAGGGISSPMTLRGGCDGGSAKLDEDDQIKGGQAGGALAIISFDSIALFATAKILAGGAGGLGGRAEGTIAISGSGGGSGGMIDLSAPQIRVQGGAQILANGGGGGGGVGVLGNGDPDTAGSCGESAKGPDIALGGAGGAATIDNSTGGVGGNGASSIANAKPGSATTEGGSGGGGGGVGHIRIHGTLNVESGAIISPQASFESF